MGLNYPLNLPLRIARAQEKPLQNNPKPDTTMQLQTLDRPTSLRLSGTDLASGGGLKVAPVTPVTPVMPVSPAAFQGSPDVVVQINPQNLPHIPTENKDWTIQRPHADTVEDPPPVPIAKMMLEFLQSMWRASGSVIEVVLAKQEAATINPNAQPGSLTKEVLTYSPSKVKKNVAA
jgi:hypothetical protein